MKLLSASLPSPQSVEAHRLIQTSIVKKQYIPSLCKIAENESEKRIKQRFIHLLSVIQEEVALDIRLSRETKQSVGLNNSVSDTRVRLKKRYPYPLLMFYCG